MIVEKRLCSECKQATIINDGGHTYLFSFCGKNKKEFQKDGGLTVCTGWVSKRDV